MNQNRSIKAAVCVETYRVLPYYFHNTFNGYLWPCEPQADTICSLFCLSVCFVVSLSPHIFFCFVHPCSEGLVLIEDLRAGGVFAAQPKSGFSTREGKNQHAPRTPEVMNGSGLADVREDFRTNVNLNLEGI